MWKPNQPGSGTGSQNPEPARPATPPTPSFDAGQRPAPAPVANPATGEQATIGKSLVIKGEVTGSESLYIDGKVEGSINLSGNRVTVGRNGQVAANITAREIVVLGKVRGNVTASDRVDIRSEGSLTGDVTAPAHLHRGRRLLQGRHRHPQAWLQREGCRVEAGCERQRRASRPRDGLVFAYCSKAPAAVF